jgi:hypothetical protein
MSVCLWLYSSCGPWTLFQFLNLYTVGRTPWTGDQSVARPLPTHRRTQTQNKRTQTPVGLEPTIPAFERAKMIHALDRAATVIGQYECTYLFFSPIIVSGAIELLNFYYYLSSRGLFFFVSMCMCLFYSIVAPAYFIIRLWAARK